MGTDEEPHSHKMEPNAEQWQLDADSHRALLQPLDKNHFFEGDYRPFAWRGTVYSSVSLKMFPAKEDDGAEIMAIVQLDFDKKAFVLVHLFNSPLFRQWYWDADAERPHIAMVQKNWGFLENPATGELVIFLSLMDCHLVFGFNMTDKSIRWKVQECYHWETGNKRFADALLPNGDLRNSGNPVLWMRSKDRADLVGMIHSKEVDTHKYHYWLVLMCPRTFKITYVSRGPVVSSNAFQLEGCVPNVLYVSSFHIYKSGRRYMMRIFGGEGDEFTISHTFSLSKVQWAPFTLDIHLENSERLKMYT